MFPQQRHYPTIFQTRFPKNLRSPLRKPRQEHALSGGPHLDNLQQSPHLPLFWRKGLRSRHLNHVEYVLANSIMRCLSQLLQLLLSRRGKTAEPRASVEPPEQLADAQEAVVRLHSRWVVLLVNFYFTCV